MLRCAASEGEGKAEDGADGAVSVPMPCPPGQPGEMRVLPVQLGAIDMISAVRLTLPKDLRKAENRRSVDKTLQELSRRYKGNVPLLDPINDMAIDDITFQSLVQRVNSLQERIAASPLHNAPDRQEKYDLYARKVELAEKVRLLRQEARESTSLAMRDIMRRKRRILRRLGYTTADDVLDVKGRVACEINTGDELVLTELIFNGVFNNLSVPHIVALLSCLVHKDAQNSEGARMREDLQGPYRQLQEIARHIARVSTDAKIELDPEEYAKSFNPDLMEPVFAWCSGAKFLDIMKLTDMYEGNIVRAIRRLDELLRQLSQAAYVIGNAELKAKFDEGSQAIRRDIVFTASLFL